MAQRSHVPKFGNWEGGDNVPYTAYFENARKEKSDGVRINPNDPEQNPGAFNIRAPPNYVHRTMANSESYSSSTTERSPSDNSVVKTNRHRRKYTSDDVSVKSVSVPKFGEWDENDPRSAEGFTVIFNKVKEEKQIAASKFPPVPIGPIQTINDNCRTSQKNESRKIRVCRNLRQNFVILTFNLN
ncbi:hypothetical protein ABFX02_13G126800 [Erythranthe guttata]